MISNEQAKPTPVYLLSGFLGSGKTTLLGNLLSEWKRRGLKPAVIMNELGEVNLDGELVDREVPMAEMLGGCICCSIRGDLGVEIGALIAEHRPDAIVIESTGAANPMETLDGVTDASMYKTVDLRAVITVVDGPELLARSRSGKGRTFKLMKEQIRCGTLLLLNKCDKLEPEQLVEAQQLLREWNGHADIVPVVRCELDDWRWLEAESGDIEVGSIRHGREHGHEEDGHEHEHSHGHVMAATYYLDEPVNSVAFEELLRGLPDNIYRAKGIVSFSDMSAGSRYLFQYAYRESDFIRIEPQGEVLDVAVFIGEHFSKEWLDERIALLLSES
ncbi:CobW family GTP-binding protein [Paenibacillus soyae]|uniref:GTP-binding protein n=1 Tax=Paenibacillus soyae TaxID=2969249 RepID=A0A9X2MNJ6_9BACL|nr:CobW family GTP-binding protein [Paenibacillus soyae]MCR2803369.1 GTP-binding protein [Paenibacillus soyae]